MVSEGIVAIAWTAPSGQFPKANLLLGLVSKAQIGRVVIKNACTRKRFKRLIRRYIHCVVRSSLIGEMRMITSPLGIIRVRPHSQDITDRHPSPNNVPFWFAANVLNLARTDS